VSASVNLPLHHKVQKFSSDTGSPEWSRKKGRKTVVWYVVHHGFVMAAAQCNTVKSGPASVVYCMHKMVTRQLAYMPTCRLVSMHLDKLWTTQLTQ